MAKGLPEAAPASLLHWRITDATCSPEVEPASQATMRQQIYPDHTAVWLTAARYRFRAITLAKLDRPHVSFFIALRRQRAHSDL
jgi:hypothetical protein